MDHYFITSHLLLTISFKGVLYKAFCFICLLLHNKTRWLSTSTCIISHSGLRIWEWLSCLVLEQDLSRSCSQDVSKDCSYLRLDYSGFPRWLIHQTLTTWLPEGSLSVLIIWKRAVPRASHPRQQGRSGSVFYNGASKGTLSLLRVLLVTKTTMWETTMQGDEDQDVRLCLTVSDWAATDPRESRGQAAESCCLSVTFTKQTCPLYSGWLRKTSLCRPELSMGSSAWC